MLEFEVLDELHEMFQVNTHGAQHIQDEVRLRLEQKTEWILTNQDNLRGLDGDGIDRIDVTDAESGFGEGVKWSEYIDHLLLALRGYPVDIYRAGLDDVKTYRQFALMENILPLGQGPDGAQLRKLSQRPIIEAGKHTALPERVNDGRFFETGCKAFFFSHSAADYRIILIQINAITAPDIIMQV